MRRATTCRAGILGALMSAGLVCAAPALAQDESDASPDTPVETVRVIEVRPAAQSEASEVQDTGAADDGRPACGQAYTVRVGDTLSGLANRYYGRASDWSLIFYTNGAALGSDPSVIYPGVRIRIPCRGETDEAAAVPVPAPEPAAEPEAAEAAPVDVAVAAPAPAPRPAAPAAAPQPAPALLPSRKIRILTADDYRPFTDRSLPNGGLAAELVEVALNATGEDFAVNWINDWSAHLDPLLTEQLYDMGFPWLRPTCEETPDDYRCKTFFFSEPLFEMLVQFFVTSDSPLTFAVDAEVEGKTLCRPAGYYTHDLDGQGRNWLADGKITLLQPKGVNDCFRLLMAGQVDAVALNEFTGRQAVAELDLREEIKTLPRAVSVQTLHLLVPKAHPRATVMLYKVNQALNALKTSGSYQEIVARHLTAFWAENG